jgi:diacylglycerol kinase (ATP)
MEPASLQLGDNVRIGVLINPLSGKNRQGSTSITRIINKHPEILQQKVQTPQDVLEALVDFGRRNVNLLVISGGDGTVQAVLTVLFQIKPFVTQPQLIVLAGGTTNMIAGDVGISGNQDKALRRLLQLMQKSIDSATRIKRPILRLQIPGHDAKYGMFFGAAGISQGIQYYQKNLHNGSMGGFPGIFITLVRFLWVIVFQHRRCAVSTRITVSLNGQPPQTENFMLMFVSTMDQLFWGLRPFWGRGGGPLLFTAVRARARFLLQLLPFLARGRKRGKATEENGYYSNNVDQVELYTGESIALDGEIYTPKSSDEPILLQCGGHVTFIRL